MQRVKLITVIFLAMAMGAIATFANALDKTSTGFYYPIGESNFDSKKGKWLERDEDHGGKYFDGFYHNGVDMMTNTKDPNNEDSHVYAIAKGVVILVSYNSTAWGPGNAAVLISHRTFDGMEFVSVYGHVRPGPKIKGGQIVEPGQYIGYTGPWCCGYHLHFGISLGPNYQPTITDHYGWGRVANDYWDTEDKITGQKPFTNGFVEPISFMKNHTPAKVIPQDFGFNSWEQINDFLTIMEMCLIFQANEEVLQAIEEVVGDISEFRERVVNSLYSQSEILDFIDAVLAGNICVGGNNTKRSSESCYTPVIPSFNPPPSDPPSNPETDIAIRDLKLRKWDSGDWVHEKEITLAAGEEYAITLKSEIENKGSKDQEDIDVDFCFVKDKKDFDVDDDRMRLTDEDEDIESGDTDESRSNEITISLDNDLKQIDIESDEGKFDLDVTEENFEDGFIKLYFYIDAETDDGEDQDVSSESNSDEYAKLVVKIKFPEVETKPASNTVQTVIRTLLLD